jgi:hypothetical protein
MKFSGLSGVRSRKLYWSIALIRGDESEGAMSVTMLMALCILGCDLLLYALFAWTYPDRSGKSRQAISRARQSRLEHARHS